MAFPNENKTLTGKDGLDITLANARKQLSYTNQSWDFSDNTFSTLYHWEIQEDIGFPYIVITSYGKPSTTVFPDQNKTLNGKDGLDITLADAQKKPSYTDQGWVFGIEEGHYRFPTLVVTPTTAYWVIKNYIGGIEVIYINTVSGIIPLLIVPVVTPTNPLLFQTESNGLCEALLVETNDPTASPVRVMTASGVKSWATI